MTNCTHENKTPYAPWCTVCLDELGSIACPFAPPNTSSETRVTLILKNGACLHDLNHLHCAKEEGYQLLLDDDELKSICGIVWFEQDRPDGTWEVRVPVAEISAILHGPMKIDQKAGE